MTSPSVPDSHFSDILISGGGLAGTVAGIALAQEKFRVTVIDPQTSLALENGGTDSRTTAISWGSRELFDTLQIWPELEKKAQPIWDIRVYENGSPWSLTYDHREVGANPLGYIIKNHDLRQGLLRAFQNTSQTHALQRISPAKAQKTLCAPQGVTILLESGEELKASLLVVSEGRHSPTRNQAGIRVTSWDYGQKALVCTIPHEIPHQGRAWEIFTPGGPLAALPLLPCEVTGDNRSGIVWSDRIEVINELLAMDEEALAAHFAKTFPFLGKVGIPTTRQAYLLGGHRVDRLFSQRLALIGDAAHLIHPVAGQGVNLGWRDVVGLRDTLRTARQQGLDIGSPTVLEGYQRARKPDQRLVMALCDGMVRLFSNHSKGLHFLRNAGFGLVETLPFLKRRLIRQASQ